MTYRAHLYSLRLAHAFRRRCLEQPYGIRHLTRDVLSGVTVGVIAIPLAMALAIASGVSPQYGLYGAIVAGFLIALTGGSRFSVSGPTAAFVVVLYPIAHAYGIAGLLLATVLAGVILVLMGVFRIGRLIEYIPAPVTLGFTGGIAVVIVVLQIRDLVGLEVENLPLHTVDKLVVLVGALNSLSWPTLVVSAVTLFVLTQWSRLTRAIPPHLPAVITGALVAFGLNASGFSVETIGSRFTFLYPGGEIGHGIPALLPHFVWPWRQPGPEGASMVLDWQLFQNLLPSSFAIAMLGAIESLLCAVVLDGMTGERHSANSELVGQGIGNIVAPFFGGITASAAISRSVTNLRAGAESPVSAMVNSLVVLVGLVLLAPALSWLPMAAMASLMIVVAWKMSEVPKLVRLFKRSPRGDIWVFFTCFGLTVLFDMVTAITAGVLLAALLFVREVAEMTRVYTISDDPVWVPGGVGPDWAVHKINGPLFFAAAERVFSELSDSVDGKRGLVLFMDGVTVMDAGGLSALEKLIDRCRQSGCELLITNLQFQPLRTLARAGVEAEPGVCTFYPSLSAALDAVRARQWGDYP